MDYAQYHIVYVDARVSRDLDGKLIQKADSSRPDGANSYGEHLWQDRNPEYLKAILGEVEEVRSNLKSLLSVFNGGMSIYFLHSPKTTSACVIRIHATSSQLKTDTLKCTSVFPATLASPKSPTSNLSVLISNLFLSSSGHQPTTGEKAIRARFQKDLRH